MNPCIKTGCNVWLESGHAIHGHLYVCHDSYILNYNPNSKYRHDLKVEDCHALFLDLQNTVPEILDLAGAGVLVIAAQAVRVTPEIAAVMVSQGCLKYIAGRELQ